MNDELATLLAGNRETLLAQWRMVFGRDPPGHTHASFMRLALAWQYQAGASKRRGAVLPGSATKTSRGGQATLRPGTQLVREWQGATYRVLVTESGFDYAGKTYRSLSAIARTITGTPWSGPAFFGVGR